jgi:altronate dehydratase small subunit
MEAKINALVINKSDSVGVAITEFKAGDVAAFKIGEEVSRIDITQDIPIYHKFSLIDVNEGDLVYKYGQVIGKAFQEIKVGQHVHTHNIAGIREMLEG